MPMLRSGLRAHQARIWASSVLASLNPRGVHGIFSPGTTGNTGQPCAAYLRAWARCGESATAATSRPDVGNAAARLGPQLLREDGEDARLKLRLQRQDALGPRPLVELGPRLAEVIEHLQR